jgi:hypothetical protein
LLVVLAQQGKEMLVLLVSTMVVLIFLAVAVAVQTERGRLAQLLAVALGKVEMVALVLSGWTEPTTAVAAVAAYTLVAYQVERGVQAAAVLAQILVAQVKLVEQIQAVAVAVAVTATLALPEWPVVRVLSSFVILVYSVVLAVL